MKKLNSSLSNVLYFIFFCSISFSLAALPQKVVAQDAMVTTKIQHDPFEYFISDYRIMVDAVVEDEQGVKLVRCYFKAEGHADFVFVDMQLVKTDIYQATLPAPAENTGQIEYLFLVVNNTQQIVKTQRFFAEQKITEVPDWQTAKTADKITVKTELAAAPASLQGFSDSVQMDVVESSARFGVVAGGIYSASVVASGSSASGAAAAATSAGTVTASSTGFSTTTVIAAGAGVVAAGAGVAAAAGGGGGGDDTVTNPNASISWGDEDTPAWDAFELSFDNDDHGSSPTGNNGIKTVRGLPVGDHSLRITCVSTEESQGDFTIILEGGARFHDYSYNRTGTLREGESRLYQVHVPEVGSAEFQW